MEIEKKPTKNTLILDNLKLVAKMHQSNGDLYSLSCDLKKAKTDLENIMKRTKTMDREYLEKKKLQQLEKEKEKEINLVEVQSAVVQDKVVVNNAKSNNAEQNASNIQKRVFDKPVEKSDNRQQNNRRPMPNNNSKNTKTNGFNNNFKINNNNNNNNQRNKKDGFVQNGNKPNTQKTEKKVTFVDVVIDKGKNKFQSSQNNKKKDNFKQFENKKGRVTKYNSALNDEEYFGKKKKKGKTEENPNYIKIENAIITTQEVSVKTLSEKIGQTASDIIKKLIILGVMANINTNIDFATAELIADEFGVKLEQKLEKSADEQLLERIQEVDDVSATINRPPVVTVMGHVDHGKTSLLDTIRKSNVTSSEAGGITQHIGAYTIDYEGNKITFIDTPGHEAFTAMRARGASVTDVAILVVAADDGVMPQTKEAIEHIQKAKVPMVVAINKIDKPEANVDRIKQQLAECNVLPEEWGGDTMMVEISARNNINIDKLLEVVLLVSEVSDLRANPNRSAIGSIIEAKLDKGKGPVATVLVMNGTLKVGDTIVSGLAVGRVRAMTNDKGQRITEATPSTPVSVLGLDRVPNAGDTLIAVDEKTAKQVIDDRKNKVQLAKQNTATSMSAEEFLKHMDDKTLYNMIIKTDVQGSYEALVQMLSAVENEEVKVACIHGGVGAVTENDVQLAMASNATIVAFNVKVENNAQILAEANGVDLKRYKIIYQVLEDAHAKIKSMLKPIFVEKVIGHCEVRVLFKISRIGTVAGCYVLDGKITKNSHIRVMRNGECVVDTTITTFQKEKQEVKEVLHGYECGIKLDGFNDIKELDIFEAYIMEQIER